MLPNAPPGLISHSGEPDKGGHRHHRGSRPCKHREVTADYERFVYVTASQNAGGDHLNHKLIISARHSAVNSSLFDQAKRRNGWGENATALTLKKISESVSQEHSRDI